MNASSVTAVAARGGSRLAIVRFFEQGMVFGSRLVVARAIGPEDTGALGVALLILTIVQTLSESGVRLALVQRRDISDIHLRSAWTFGVVRGLLAGAVVVAAAPFIATVFDTDAAADLIRAVGLVVVIDAATGPAVQVLERDLEFARLGRILALSGATTAVVTVTVVGAWADPIAMVIGAAAGKAVIMGWSIWRRPTGLGRVDRNALTELLRYGRWIVASSIAVLLLTNIDDAVLGVVDGAAALGTYQTAYLVASLPVLHASSVLNQVTFSTFARLLDDRPALGHTFLRVYEVTALGVVAISTVLAITAIDLVELGLGRSWRDAAPVLSVLAILGTFRAMGAVTTPLLRAVGRPGAVTATQWTMLGILVVIVGPMADRHGALGVAWATLVPHVVAHWMRYPTIAHEIGRSVVRIVRGLVPALVSGAAMTAAILLVRRLWAVDLDDHAVIAARLVVELVAGTLGLLAAVQICERLGVSEIRTGVSAFLRLVRTP